MFSCISHVPDIFVEQRAHQSAFGRRAYSRMMEGNEVTLFGSPIAARPDSAGSSSIWEAEALPDPTRPPRHIADTDDEDDESEERDLPPMLNLPKVSLLRDNDIMSQPPPLSHIPSIAGTRSKAASLPAPGPTHREFKIRPLLIKNERHREICYPGGKKWKLEWKPVSYKNFVLPSVTKEDSNPRVL